jgi:hypothetical protein
MQALSYGTDVRASDCGVPLPGAQTYPQVPNRILVSVRFIVLPYPAPSSDLYLSELTTSTFFFSHRSILLAMSSGEIVYLSKRAGDVWVATVAQVTGAADSVIGDDTVGVGSARPRSAG